MRQSKRDASPFNTTVDDGVRLVAAADRLAGGTAAARRPVSGRARHEIALRRVKQHLI